jgi:urease accessory protein UreH
MKDITTEEAVQIMRNHICWIENKTVKQAIEKILNELEKKDKIIDAMAKFIDTELSSEHLTRVLKKEVLPLKTYREDIKQYFEKEVKDE